MGLDSTAWMRCLMLLPRSRVWLMRSSRRAVFWWFAASSVLFRVREWRSAMRFTLVLYVEMESWMEVICGCVDVDV